LPTALHPNHPPLLAADAHEALIGLAQMNVIELHTWNALQPDLQHPDRFVLDPDPALSWRYRYKRALGWACRCPLRGKKLREIKVAAGHRLNGIESSK
jgi:DNA primase